MSDDALRQEPRVAVLEQIARNTEQALLGIRDDIRGIRDEMHGIRDEWREEMRALRKAQHDDFRLLITIWISGVAALLAVIAHGFRWI